MKIKSVVTLEDRMGFIHLRCIKIIVLMIKRP